MEIVFKEGRKQDVPANVLDISLARRELNWRPEIELPQGIRLMFSSWSASKHKFMIKHLSVKSPVQVLIKAGLSSGQGNLYRTVCKKVH